MKSEYSALFALTELLSVSLAVRLVMVVVLVEAGVLAVEEGVWESVDTGHISVGGMSRTRDRLTIEGVEVSLSEGLA